MVKLFSSDSFGMLIVVLSMPWTDLDIEFVIDNRMWIYCASPGVLLPLHFANLTIHINFCKCNRLHFASLIIHILRH